MSARRTGSPFRNFLLHGPPGTGKTMFARALAQKSGMDYAIMTGGDVGPLGKSAVTELHKLFRWAKKTKKGMVLFVDEADAFLRLGRGFRNNAMSEEMRNVLSAFLHHTGTESDKVCVVLATNAPDVLDKAVIDRMDEQFEFPLPGPDERRRMLNMFLKEYIYSSTKKGKRIIVDPSITEEFWDSVALRTEGFSGRQIAKLVISLQSAIFGAGTNVLSKAVAEIVVNWKVAHFRNDRAAIDCNDEV